MDLSNNNKHKYAEQIVKMLNGGVYNTDSKVTLRQAMLAFSQARDKAIRDLMWSLKNSDSSDVYGQLVTPYKAESKKSGNRYYIPLKYRPINLLDNEGIFQVYFTDDITEEENHLLPLPPSFFSLYISQEAYDLEGHAGYIPKQDKLFLKGKDVEREGINFTVEMVASASEIGEYDFCPIPPDMELEVLSATLNILGVQTATIQDIINDNVETVQGGRKQ